MEFSTSKISSGSVGEMTILWLIDEQLTQTNFGGMAIGLSLIFIILPLGPDYIIK